MENSHFVKPPSLDGDKDEIRAEQAKMIAGIRLCMEKEIDPQDPEAVVLAGKWVMLMDELFAGDGTVEEGLRNMADGGDEEIREKLGEAIPDAEILAYIRKSFAD